MSVRGETGWHAVNQKQFGKARWPALYKSLKNPIRHVALVNPFLSTEGRSKTCEENDLRQHSSIPIVFEKNNADDQEALPLCVEDDEDVVAPVKSSGSNKRVDEELPESVSMPLYFLDGASAIAAMALDVEKGQSVLDLCAAPGGKSAVLASMMFAPQPSDVPGLVEKPSGLLVCNESSRSRIKRLQRVLSGFCPTEVMAPGGNVVVTNVDASFHANATPPVAIARLGNFDRVLVDAPCSSDRHLALQGKSGLAQWAVGLIKSNAERQLEILLCAALLVKPGGVILYCTCALAEKENDGVVTKFLKKQGLKFSVEPLQTEDGAGALANVLSTADVTANGVLFLPDTSSYGPMYMAKIRRNS